MKALDFASKYTTITKKERETILHARKSILINHNEVWTKKDGIFDVAMGAYDSAEISDLVGLMILAHIKSSIPNINFGLYRDDGLAVMKSGKGCHVEKTKKEIDTNFQIKRSQNRHQNEIA